MDRRHFLQRTSVLAASAGALAVVPDASATASETGAGARPAMAPPPLRVVYLQGSAQGQRPGEGRSTPMRWVRWTGRRTLVHAQDGLRDIRIVELHRGVAGPGFASLDIRSRHMVAGSREPVEFFAWSYARDGTGRNSAPVCFSAMPSGNAVLRVGYRVDGYGPASAAGWLSLPIGSPGLRDGIYAVLSPRAGAGLLPDPGELAATGDPRHPLACASGAEPDFDHLLVSIAPANG